MVELFYKKEERRELLDIFPNLEYSFPTKAALLPRSANPCVVFYAEQSIALHKSIASPKTLRVQ